MGGGDVWVRGPVSKSWTARRKPDPGADPTCCQSANRQPGAARSALRRGLVLGSTAALVPLIRHGSRTPAASAIQARIRTKKRRRVGGHLRRRSPLGLVRHPKPGTILRAACEQFVEQAEGEYGATVGETGLAYPCPSSLPVVGLGVSASALNTRHVCLLHDAEEGTSRVLEHNEVVSSTIAPGISS